MGITTQATYFQISGPVSPFLRKTPAKFVNLYGFSHPVRIRKPVCPGLPTRY